MACSTIFYVEYYTPEVPGSSVWQISKKYFAGVWSKISHVLVDQLETFSPIKFTFRLIIYRKYKPDSKVCIRELVTMIDLLGLSDT